MYDFIVMMVILCAIYKGVKNLSRRTQKETTTGGATGRGVYNDYAWAEQCRLFRDQMQRDQNQASRD